MMTAIEIIYLKRLEVLPKEEVKIGLNHNGIVVVCVEPIRSSMTIRIYEHRVLLFISNQDIKDTAWQPCPEL